MIHTECFMSGDPYKGAERTAGVRARGVVTCNSLVEPLLNWVIFGLDVCLVDKVTSNIQRTVFNLSGINTPLSCNLSALMLLNDARDKGLWPCIMNTWLHIYIYIYIWKICLWMQRYSACFSFRRYHMIVKTFHFKYHTNVCWNACPV